MTWRRWFWRGLLMGLPFSGCTCPPPPPSIVTECWTHSSTETGTACGFGDHDIEPNDNVSMANTVSIATCNAQEIVGRVATDTDVFRTHGRRCSGRHPRAHLETTDTEIRLCMFIACQTGKTGLQSCLSGVPTQLPEGMLGCCYSGAGDVEIDGNCDADSQFSDHTPESKKPTVNAWVVVDREKGTGCADYRVTYQF